MPKAGLVALIVAYMLSQFYRAMLAVLAPALEADLGVTADNLATASGLWFLTFALMQIPVGEALDRIGPKRTAAVMLLIGGGGGAALFGLAQAPWHINAAMIGIGIGCAPVLMASYFIFARSYPPAMFATLGAMVIGFGSIGNILSSAPTAWAADLIGWRGTLFVLAGLTALVALAIWVLVRDPERVSHEGQSGSVLDLLKMPVLWPIFAILLVNYMPSAGLRGLWAGPYAADIFGTASDQIGVMTLIMACAMIAGNFAYGPLDRIFGTRKWVVIVGNSIGVAALAALWLAPDSNFWLSVALFAVVGAAGASFPVLVAHGRSFFPPHLTGRGVTLLNLFGIAGVGLGQVITGRIHKSAGGGLPAYEGIFAFMAIALAAGVLIYITSRDRTD